MQEEIAMLQRQRTRLDEKILQLMDDSEARKTQEAETRDRRDRREVGIRCEADSFQA